METASSLAFVAVTLLVFFANGLPFVLLGPAESLRRNLLVAPILGTALLSFLLSVLYRFGIPPHAAMLGTTVLSLAVAGVLAIASPDKVHILGSLLSKKGLGQARPFIVSSAFVFILDLLPRYIGGFRYAIFQVNPGDSFNYLSATFAYSNYSFVYLVNLVKAPPPLTPIVFAGDIIYARPAVALLYGSLTKPFSLDVLQYSYEFRGVLQFGFFTAMVNLMFCLMPHRRLTALILSAGFAVGFYSQYVLDINAWSELLAIPMQLVLVSEFCALFAKRVFTAGSSAPIGYRFGGMPASELTGSLVVLSALSVGVLYAYPEITPITGLFLTGAFAFCATATLRRRRWGALRDISSYALIPLATTVLAATLFWPGTVGFLFNQFTLATRMVVNWHQVFDSYVIVTDSQTGSYSASKWFCDVFYKPVTAFAFVAKGLLGLFFIPLRVLKPSLIIFVWSVALSIGAIIVAWGILVSVTPRSTDERVGMSRFLLLSWLVGGTLSLTIPIYLLLIGQYYSAGKGFSTIFPFAFVLICLPIITQRAPVFQFCSWSIVAGHLILGIARPVAVGLNPFGHFYGNPYLPAGGGGGAAYDFNIGRHSAELASCRLIRIEINSGYLERAVEIYLMEKGLPWFSSREQYGQYGGGRDLGKKLAPDGQVEDCVIVDQSLPVPPFARLPVPPSARLISLGSSR